jgi:hypothetical protein
MTMRSTVICLLLLATGTLGAAQVYRFVDDNGNVVYSDRPGADDVELIFLNTATATPAPSSSATGTSGDAEESGDGGSMLTIERDPAEVAAERLQNCQLARARQERYSFAHRIYREATDGERVYLTDTELDEIRSQAVADVEEWCG